MLDGQIVFRRLVQLIECFDDEENIYMPYCETAAAVMNAKIRTDADASDIRLVTAAAASAYCRYTVAKSASDGDIDSIKAGDITVSGNGENAVKAAERLMSSAITDAAPLLIDTQFSFGAV